MCERLLLAALLALPVLAQNPPAIPTTSSAPSGNCQQQGIQILVPNGTIYTCQSGTWAAVAGGGSTVSLTAGNTGIVLSPSTITGTGTISLGAPSASTLGGIQSAAAVTHQWINSISTSGVPALSQPAFTDVSGQATNAQLATQTANTVLGALTATTPSGLAMPSCSGASNALIWTTSTGFGCNTITASLGSQAAYTLLGNGTGSSATPTALANFSIGSSSYANAGLYSTFNAQGNASTTALNGGFLVFNNGSYAFGTDLEYSNSSSKYGLRLFAANIGVVTISNSGTAVPLQQSSYSDVWEWNVATHHSYSEGTAPTLSSCGTSPTVSSDATDAMGTVTIGATGTGCTVTFANAYTSPAPHCTLSSHTFALTAYSESTTALTVTGTGTFDYACLGK